VYVIEWQKILGNVKQDGIFGENTERATKSWQAARGLINPVTKLADGIVGEKTWSAALGVKVISPPSGIAAPVGTGSGAVSVAKDGSIDDAFDELVALAIANGNVQQLTNLAEQAKARGLNAVYNSIQEEIARIVGTVPILTSGPPAIPKEASIALPTGRAILSWKAGSRGPDVMEWQRLIGAKIDGIFGENTHKATMAWQQAKGLKVDGIVGPDSWRVAYEQKPELASTPRPSVIVTSPSVRPELSWAAKSYGPHVIEWQTILKTVKVDGQFGENTHKATVAWQKARGLKADGIVGTNTWKAAYASTPSLAIIPTAAPVVQPVPVRTIQPVAQPIPQESDKRKAAREMTDYLRSIGGLAGRPKEDKPRIVAWLSRLGVPDPKGLYGRQGAKAVLMEGLVPVVPYYWPSTGTQAAKTEFSTLIKSYLAADPQRASEWNALLTDINRA
jgi:peptidoglycan hydrolase-like protein with peptidoglycan-binding domain